MDIELRNSKTSAQNVLNQSSSSKLQNEYQIFSENLINLNREDSAEKTNETRVDFFRQESAKISSFSSANSSPNRHKGRYTGFGAGFEHF